MISFVFPGQGSQVVGMCKDVYDSSPIARKTFQEADEALGFSISKMCFEGPEDDLRLTYNTQPAILTVSVALARVLEQEGFKPEIAAGHSLGEYSALVAAGAIDFADAVRTVRKRGQFMQEAVPVGKGAMAAVMGLDDAKIIEICQKVEQEGGVVQAVNFNCPGQVVIAGSAEAVDKANVLLKEAGAKRAVLLPVSAPFHSSLMQPAAARLQEVLDSIEMKNATIPVVANVNAQKVTDAQEIKKLLVEQAAAPVRWVECVQTMQKEGVTLFVEVGPGKVLSGLSKKIASDIPIINVENVASLEKALDYFKGGR